MNYLFVFTFGIVLFNMLYVITLFGKSSVSWPCYKHLSPTEWWVLYPSFFYQIYWWGMYLHLIH